MMMVAMMLMMVMLVVMLTNHDVGYDVIDDANNHVDDDVGNGVRRCHPWHDHPFFFLFILFFFLFFFSKNGRGEAPFMF